MKPSEMSREGAAASQPADPATPGGHGCADRLLRLARDDLLETWSRSTSLEHVVGDLSRTFARTALEPGRVSLAILPTFVAIDGLQWVWRADAPGEVTSITRPYGFLDTPEHLGSPLHEVITTGHRVRRRLGIGPTGFAFLDELGRQGATDYIAFPLMRRYAAPCILSLTTGRSGGWSDVDLAAIDQILPVLSLLVEVSEAQRLLTLAATDPLTGLANRRQFERLLRQCLATCRRSQTPIGVLYVDIDHFKAYNDGRGHLKGDECLVSIARIASGALRDSDVIARIGGEEFAVILPDASEQETLQMAQALRTQVEVSAIPHPRSPTAPWVTVSVGAVWMPPGNDATGTDLVSRADAALYRAKALGRNQVVRQALDLA